MADSGGSLRDTASPRDTQGLPTKNTMTAPEPALVRVLDAVCEECGPRTGATRPSGELVPTPYVATVDEARGNHTCDCGGQVRVATEPYLPAGRP